MNKVVKTFFLTKKEIEKLGDPYIVANMPHYELESGAVLYTKAGGPSSIEHWVEPLTPKGLQK